MSRIPKPRKNANPKSKDFTPEQEAALEQGERNQCRAQLLIRGSAATLTAADYYSADLPVVIEALQEADRLRAESWKLHKEAKL